MIVKKILSKSKIYRPTKETVKGLERTSWASDGEYCDLEFTFKGYRYSMELNRIEVESLIHDLNNFIDDTKKGDK